MELPEDTLSPGRVTDFLEIEENTQDKLTIPESCRDMFQTEKRVRWNETSENRTEGERER